MICKEMGGRKTDHDGGVIGSNIWSKSCMSKKQDTYLYKKIRIFLNLLHRSSAII